MTQILLFLLFLIAFLYIIGRVNRKADDTGSTGSDRRQEPEQTRKIYETEPDEETPGIEWEVTEGDAMLRQLVEHCKDKPGEVSKLIKTWIVGGNNS